MQFILVFGVNYYLVLGAVPRHIQHRITYITNKWGNTLDGIAPKWAQLQAAQMLRKYGALNV